MQKQRICRLERKQGDTISNLSQHSWPTLLPPTHRPWKASPQCTNPYFHSKNVALSIQAKHSQAILTLADICQLVKQGIDQILITEAGDSRV